MRLLIVEDEPKTAALLGTALRQEGFEGFVTSTLLNLFLLPSLYMRFGDPSKRDLPT